MVCECGSHCILTGSMLVSLVPLEVHIQDIVQREILCTQTRVNGYLLQVITIKSQCCYSADVQVLLREQHAHSVDKRLFFRFHTKKNYSPV